MSPAGGKSEGQAHPAALHFGSGNRSGGGTVFPTEMGVHAACLNFRDFQCFLADSSLCVHCLFLGMAGITQMTS